MAISTSSRKSSPPSISENQIFRLIDRALAVKYARRLRLHGQSTEILKPRMDMRDNPDSPQITATLELPGLKKDEISLRIVDGSLVIWGERHSRLISEEGSPPDGCKVQEIKYGKFRRVIPLPQGVQTSEVSASMTDGMLTIAWPRHTALSSQTVASGT